jgi:hypothetical protein
VTGPVVPPGGEDELREALATAIVDAWRTANWDEKVLELARRFADALLPVVLADRERHARQRAAEEIERLADDQSWTTQHDNEVVSSRELYEQVARLRGELEPVTFDFPPADPVASLEDFLR